MKKITKLMSLILALALTVAMVAGCSNNNIPAESGPDPNEDESPPAVTLTVDPISLNLEPGDTATLEYAVEPDDTAVAFSSEDNNVVMVDVSGKVVALAEGETVIRATVDGADPVTVPVKVARLPVIELEADELEIKIGEPIDLKPVITGSEDAPVFTSDNESVATVDEDGKVTAISEGTATISIAVGEVVKTVMVTVPKNTIASTNATTGNGNPISPTNKSSTTGSRQANAKSMFDKTDIKVYDWNTPATHYTSSSYAGDKFYDANGNLLAVMFNSNGAFNNREQYGYEKTIQGKLDMFNDFRGVERAEIYIPTEYHGEFTMPADFGYIHSGNAGASGGGKSDVDTDAYADKLIELVNAERKAAGLSSVTKDSGLMDVAQIRVEEIAEKFDHTRPNGEKDSYAGLPDYEWVMCNLSRGGPTPEATVNSWMNSSGHKRNILYAGHDKIGGACYQSDNGTMCWVIVLYAEGGQYPDY